MLPPPPPPRVFFARRVAKPLTLALLLLAAASAPAFATDCIGPSCSGGNYIMSGSVGIGTASPNSGAVLDMSQATNAVILPRGTTGQEPTGVVGMIRYNTTTNAFEGYSGSTPSWGALASGGSTSYLGTGTSAASPSRSSSETNTGLFSIGTGRVSVASLGNELVRIGSSVSGYGGVAIGTGYVGSSAPTNGMIVQGNVGIGTASPGFALSVGDGSANDGAIMALGYGTVGTSGQSLTVSGPGTRMFWYPKKAAFRAGAVDTNYVNDTLGDEWNDANIGNYSAALGRNCGASGIASVCLGENGYAYGEGAVALGYQATSYNGIAIGGYAFSGPGNTAGTAIGAHANTYGSSALALSSFSATAYGDYSIALGANVNVGLPFGQGNGYGNYSMAIGLGAPAGTEPEVTGTSSFGIFMGDQSNANVSASNVMAILGGKVGIGTVGPQATLDVNGYARLALNSSAPATCSSSNEGAIALTHLAQACVCDTTPAWHVLNTSTACSW